MRIAILTSGILPVPAVQGGAVENFLDFFLEYNNKHQLHDITVYSVYHPTVMHHHSLQSEVNHYHFINVSSFFAKIKRHLYGYFHKDTHHHFSIEYFEIQPLPYQIPFTAANPSPDSSSADTDAGFQTFRHCWQHTDTSLPPSGSSCSKSRFP